MITRVDFEKLNSLYVHIPYCEHICFYCDFVKIKKTEKTDVFAYLKMVEEELNEYGNRLDNIETIYIGGGTPSALTIDETEEMLRIIGKYTKCVLEYTIELNPESVTEEKLNLYKKYGINRLSIGVQSFDNDLLKKIGRIHDNKKAIDCFNLCRKNGFNNISIDLMYNLFDQTNEHVKTDLKFISELKPDHISWYSLIMKESSVWGKRGLKLPSNDELFDETVNEGLKALGYNRYEISNYYLNDNPSIHNVNYWNNNLFAGVGVGAAGFEYINGNYCLTINKGNVEKYHKEFEIIEKDDYPFQILMMGLRRVEGIDLTKDVDAYLIVENYKDIINELVNDKLLEFDGRILKCTPRGFDIQNEVLLKFI